MKHPECMKTLSVTLDLQPGMPPGSEVTGTQDWNRLYGSLKLVSPISGHSIQWIFSLKSFLALLYATKHVSS